MTDKFDVEYKTIVELRRMTQHQLVNYTRQLQEAIFGAIDESDE